MTAMGPIEAFGRQEDRMFLHLTLLDQSGERGLLVSPGGAEGSGNVSSIFPPTGLSSSS